ncbi:hypothetical protein [Saccharopolyspora hordei]|uniref:Uncharacterized protein n=1 Tax=Saccharopolyspora hordei TaxID=1838 RepID=A0A853APE0_9PSEU|nr:hypothetical protein [Saccharopolyspora hordei]NYI85239.1 hypothetical protein [Saccharopolyspora hordei]
MSEQPEEPETLEAGAESVDEDEFGRDPVELGVEPPEGWTQATEKRPTPRDEREGDTHDERLAQERPDEDP